MEPVFVLVHSPSLGPVSWEPLAAELRARGREVSVPSLLGVADGPAPAWPRVVDAVSGAVADLPPSARLVLVVHSNAGLFVPVLVDGVPRPVAALVFLDAGLPTPGGSPVAPPEFLAFLEDKADADGLLPPWTRWWDDADVAPLFPDDATRAAVQAEEPRLPLRYYTDTVPAPDAWEYLPAGYVAFGDAYGRQVAQARSRGWPVVELPGLHLHQLVDPHTVADAVVALAAGLIRRRPADRVGSMRAEGTFSVVASAPTDVVPTPAVATAMQVGVMTMEKRYEGDVSGRSATLFTSAYDPAAGAGTYVALEAFEGSIGGRQGTFNFVHSATTTGADRTHEFFLVVPASGTGDLAGITGAGGLRIDDDGSHRVWFDYDLP